MSARIAIVRIGFSLVEVMLAVTILAIGLSVLLSDFLSSFRARDFAQEQFEAQEVSRTVLNRLLGAPTAFLGVEPWAVARPRGGTPLTVSGTGSAADDLVLMGIRSEPAAIQDLRIYVEYYRGIQSIDPSSGAPTVLNGVLDSYADGDPPELSISNFAGYTVNSTTGAITAIADAWTDSRALDPTRPPAVQVPQTTPVVIRIIAIWGRGAQRLELHGARLF